MSIPRLHDFIQKVWNEGDAQASLSFIGDSYTVFHDPGDPWDGKTLTPQGFVDRVNTSRAMAPDQVFTVLDSFEADSKVAINWTWVGTHTGDIAGIPAVGKRITMSGMTIYTFDAGRIRGHWQIADRLGVYQQLMGQR